MIDLSCSKPEIRKQAKALRKTLDMPKLSQMIALRLQQESFFSQAQLILSFCAFSDEVNLWPLIEQGPEKKWVKRWAFPRMGKKTPEAIRDDLFFHHVDAETTFETHAYGIAEPTAESLLVEDWSQVDLIFLPALVFDRSGYRIGYGKGYYDRFMETLPSDFRGKRVGVIPDALLVEALPRDSWDLPADILVTESQTLFLA